MAEIVILGKGIHCPQLTHFILEGVVLREDGVGILNSSSSNKPIHIGIPAVHKATEMIFFKVTFWQKRNENIPHGDVVIPGYTHTHCRVCS